MTLGVDPAASATEIKQAYRDKAQRCHPDKGGTNEEMIILTRAYNEGLASAAA